MELVTGSSTSVFKLCAFPSGAGVGRGGSLEPGSVPENTPQPTILAKWKPATGSVTSRELGEVETMVALPDGVSFVSAHAFLDEQPGTILVYHSMTLEMVMPPKATEDANSKASSSNGAGSKKKDKKKQEKAPKPVPKITPSCLPLATLFRPTSKTASLWLIPNTTHVLHVLTDGKCFIIDFSDVDALRVTPSSSAPTKKKSSTPSQPAYIVSEFDLGQAVVTTRLNPFNPAQLSVVGPHDTLLCVYDIEKKEMTWRSRNVKDDTLRMKVPISDMDSDWMDEKKLVTCTAHGFVRIYDLAQRQPIMSFSLPDEYAKSSGPSKFQQLTKGDANFALRKCACNPTKRTELAVAANTGDVFMLNMERRQEQGHIMSRLRGVQGAVRALLFHPSRESAVVAAGLDRFLRSWNASTSRSLGTLYTKLRQNAIVFTNVLAPILKEHKAKVKDAKRKQKEAEENSDTDDDAWSSGDFSDISDGEDLWDDMEVAGLDKKQAKESSKKASKKRTHSDSDEEPANSPLKKKKKVK